MMGKKRKLEETFKENCDEWLSTRNRKKISPRDPTPKRRHHLASRFVSRVEVTQNSPPPPELFNSTKQSTILSFFNTGETKPEIHAQGNSKSNKPLTCMPVPTENSSKSRITDKGNNSYNHKGTDNDQSLQKPVSDIKCENEHDKSKQSSIIGSIERDESREMKRDVCGRDDESITESSLELESDSLLDSFETHETLKLDNKCEDSFNQSCSTLPECDNQRSMPRSETMTTSLFNSQDFGNERFKNESEDLHIESQNISRDTLSQDVNLHIEGMKKYHLPESNYTDFASLDSELESSEFTLRQGVHRPGYLIDSEDADKELQNFSLDCEASL